MVALSMCRYQLIYTPAVSERTAAWKSEAASTIKHISISEFARNELK